MTHTTLTPSATVPVRGGVLRRWPRWAPWAATLWALGYGLTALGWTLTGAGYPMGPADPEGDMSLLGSVPADVGAPLFAAVALAAAGTGAVMARYRPGVAVPRWWRRFAVGFGGSLAVALLVVVPDTRILAVVGYLPMILLKAPFDAEIRAQVGDALGVEHLHQVVALAGGFLWAAATVVYARRTAGSCVRCGRPDRSAAVATVLRWARPAVYVAAAIPALYAVTRWIWVAGIPLGIDEELHAEGMADGSLWSGAWLASFALVGTVLTLGLVQRWGEVFPRWVPVLRGRRVPVGLAVAPASVVAALVTSGGLGLIKAGIADSTFTSDDWAAVGPALLWPLWGVALAVATLAYWLRRRGTCADCGLSEAA
ncbi:hypothetical protein [Jiangella rhizosphaerae]|uniref:Uncharacterized protein n=1 Tax=Jiangella rhizosphaerae TaxID=2293569 RepID=A0A418KNR2_9ACTN|nr:hypothetical protein [Jiangella rhizosphaerae]RIQ20718.1 hypothetical protein DY240_16855 [Jiangella rhizosphaerae]